MGRRCCEKMPLKLNEEGRERVFLELGKFFCHQTEYRFRYEEDELKSAFPEDSDFDLGFCLFCKVASTRYQTTKFAYQLNHKLLYDYLKLNFVRLAATHRSEELPCSLRNGFKGLEIVLDLDETPAMEKELSVSGIQFLMDIGSVVVGNISTRPSARVYMEPKSAGRGVNWFRFGKVPVNASDLGHLFFRSDVFLDSLLSKTFEFNGKAFLHVHLSKMKPVYSKSFHVKYTENDVGHESLDSFLVDSFFPFPDFFMKLSRLRDSSDRNLLRLQMYHLNSEVLRSLLDEFFAFEEKTSACDSKPTPPDVVWDLVRVLMTQTIEEEHEKLELTIWLNDNCIYFYRWKRSNEFILVEDINKKRKVLTFENVLKGESYQEEFFPNISKVERIWFLKLFNRPLKVPPEFSALPLSSQLLYVNAYL